MPAQTQKQPQTKSFIDEDPDRYQNETPKTSREQKSREVKPLKVILIALACIACLIGGIWFRKTSTLLVEKRTRTSYLPAEDFMLVESETGEPVQKLNSFSFNREYSFYSSHGHLETTKGLKPGDSWEEFVEKYGDYYMDTAYAYHLDENGFPDFEKGSVYVYDEMTVSEYNRQYVETGAVDPATDEIDITFSVYTDGRKLYYGDSEVDAYRRNYYDEPSIFHPLSNYADLGEFSLTITFSPDANENRSGGGIDYICSDYYR
ncbi:MAG: hypothetical protein J6S26_03420 [Solobacterium sp.]|nr:hypothetical protein [Solobacterium sp.]